jgi:hypothetical protein
VDDVEAAGELAGQVIGETAGAVGRGIVHHQQAQTGHGQRPQRLGHGRQVSSLIVRRQHNYRHRHGK